MTSDEIYTNEYCIGRCAVCEAQKELKRRSQERARRELEEKEYEIKRLYLNQMCGKINE